MKFSIATIEFWKSKGFNTEGWRKSTDGNKALCHSKFAETLVDLDTENIVTLISDSEEFKQLIKDEFTDEDSII